MEKWTLYGFADTKQDANRYNDLHEAILVRDMVDKQRSRVHYLCIESKACLCQSESCASVGHTKSGRLRDVG
jgi:hypothetical protein